MSGMPRRGFAVLVGVWLAVAGHDAAAEGERQVVERIAGLLARWGHAGDPTPTAFVLFGTLEGAVHAHVLGKPVVDDVRFIDALVEAMIRIASPASP